MSELRRMTDRPIDKPPAGGSVWPRQSCPCFSLRDSAPREARECWYCRHADFHLTEPVALEVGICCWPAVKTL